MRTHTTATPSRQAGFALILALLALVLLTVLGLTLAATTTSEVQIAANYEYGRVALYNAEAGLQVARYSIAQLGKAGALVTALPAIRTVPSTDWAEGYAPAPAAPINTMDYYPNRMTPAGGNPGCDTRGNMGYGIVLVDGAGLALQDQTSWRGGEFLQGTFTVWVRRPLTPNDNGTFHDGTAPNELIVTVVGTAPYSTGLAGLAASQRANQAVRVIEQTLMVPEGKACVSGIYQSGRDQLGTNFDPCGVLEGLNFAPGWL